MFRPTLRKFFNKFKEISIFLSFVSSLNSTIILILFPHNLSGTFEILNLLIGIFSLIIKSFNRDSITSGKTISPPELKALSILPRNFKYKELLI